MYIHIYRWAAYFPFYQKYNTYTISIIPTSTYTHTYTDTYKHIYYPNVWFQPYRLSKMRFRPEDMFPQGWRRGGEKYL